MMRADQERVRDLLTETVTLLCKNGLHFDSELRIEGVLGITIDKRDVFIVHINESLNSGKLLQGAEELRLSTKSYSETTDNLVQSSRNRMPAEQHQHADGMVKLFPAIHAVVTCRGDSTNASYSSSKRKEQSPSDSSSYSESNAMFSGNEIAGHSGTVEIRETSENSKTNVKTEIVTDDERAESLDEDDESNYTQFSAHGSNAVEEEDAMKMNSFRPKLIKKRQCIAPLYTGPKYSDSRQSARANRNFRQKIGLSRDEASQSMNVGWPNPGSVVDPGNSGESTSSVAFENMCWDAAIPGSANQYSNSQSSSAAVPHHRSSSSSSSTRQKTFVCHEAGCTRRFFYCSDLYRHQRIKHGANYRQPRLSRIFRNMRARDGGML